MWKWNHLQAAKGFTYWQGWEMCGILWFSVCSWGLSLPVLTLVRWISSLVGKQFCLLWSASRGSAWSSVVILFPSLWKKRENWGSISIFLPPSQEVVVTRAIQKPLEPREHQKWADAKEPCPEVTLTSRPRDIPKCSSPSGKNVKDLKLPGNSDGFFVVIQRKSLATEKNNEKESSGFNTKANGHDRGQRSFMSLFLVKVSFSQVKHVTLIHV